ncbi:MAG: M20 family metallo-hydrolase [Myxococcales bacterium]|nr:M20 family metallo-hydrolase [Myxococcales bacterium]
MALAEVGAIDGGGVCRLALTDADKAGRDLVVSWMRELGLTVTVDRIGNVLGARAGAAALPPVIIGSHIDTVRTGGKYDGNYGVLAGLEVIERLAEAGVVTRHPVAVGFFTNEEGARFAPDMLGSAVHQGELALDLALATAGIDGPTVGAELTRIGYAGETPVGGAVRAAAFLELHVEQGPVLEREGQEIGAVTGVQGISWTELTLHGVSNHAGTTPMSMRTDAGYVAAEISCFVRRLTRELGGAQVATVGHQVFAPNLVNVIPNRVVMTLDLRNTDEQILQQAERQTFAFVEQIAASEGVRVEQRTLARFAPVAFSPEMVARVEAAARAQGRSVRRMPSGAGHDAQMFAPHCPTGMIFVPSAGGISHNVREYTAPAQLIAGANVLLEVVQEVAG